jgi:Outer membrane protein beta-barrel domain
MSYRIAHHLAPLAALVAGALFATPVMAQSAGAGAPLRLGILLGANSATLGGSDADDADRRTALLGGVYLVKSLSSGLSLRPELLFSQKGAKGTVIDDEQGGSAEVGFEVSYIDVPVLLQLDLGSSGAARPHVYAGPSFGFKTDCKLKGSEGPVEVTLDCDDEAFELESFDLGGVIGGGVRFGLGALQGTVGARYQHGFSDIAKDAKAQNRVVSVYAGLEFGRR